MHSLILTISFILPTVKMVGYFGCALKKHDRGVGRRN